MMKFDDNFVTNGILLTFMLGAMFVFVQVQSAFEDDDIREIGVSEAQKYFESSDESSEEKREPTWLNI